MISDKARQLLPHATPRGGLPESGRRISIAVVIVGLVVVLALLYFFLR